MNKGWKKLLIGTTMLLGSPLLLVCAPEIAAVAAVAAVTASVQFRPLDAQGGLHDHETVYVKISLPLAADNDYQGQSGTAVISLNAVQQRNNDSFANQAWAASGPGTTSVSYGGSNPNSVEFNYNDGQSSAQYSGQQWDFTNTTTATKTETINFNYDYSGLHSWYDANAYAEVFVNGPNGQTVTTLWSSPVSGDFDHTGSAAIQVYQGYTYGFIVGGSNYDYSQIMEGHLTVTRTN